jgi:tetratricopeptide (TPR) repeat protein
MRAKTPILSFVLLLLLLPACAPPGEEPVSDEIPRIADLSGGDPQVATLIENGIAMVEKDPEAALPRAGLGMIYHANEHFEAAKIAYRQALVREPENARWLYHLARVQERLGDAETAIETIGRSIEAEPRYAPSYWRRGGWRLDLGLNAEAEADFREAVEIAPTDPAGPTGLGRALLSQDRPEEAREVLEALVREQPDDPLAHLLLGNAYRALGRMDEAQRHLVLGQSEQVIREDGWTAGDILRFKLSFGAQMQTAVTLSGAGQIEQAIEILETLQRHDPDDARMLRHLGRNYLLVGRQEESVSTFERGLELHPQDAKLLSEAASAFHMAGDSARALEVFDRAIAIKPEDGLAHARRGVILQSFNRYAEAIEAYRTSLSYRPQDGALIRRIGDCHNHMKQHDLAAAAYREALEIDPDDAELLVRMGFTLHRLGRFEGAEQAVARALELEPGNPEWAKFLEQLRREQRASAGGQG